MGGILSSLPNMRSSSIVLLSGGLDSLAAFHWAAKNTDLVFGLTLNYGQRAAVSEMNAAAKVCRHYDIKHLVINLPWYSTLKSSALMDPAKPIPEVLPRDLDNLEITRQTAEAVWVPNRNGVFINVAASLAESWLANWIVVGFNVEEAATFPDNSTDFVEASNRFLHFSTGGRVSLHAPMASRTKKEIVAWALENEIDLSPLWSCYHEGEKMCGVCESCSRCRRALNQAGATEWLEKLFR